MLFFSRCHFDIFQGRHFEVLSTRLFYVPIAVRSFFFFAVAIISWLLANERTATKDCAATGWITIRV
jgi:hypothetical protein